MRAMLLKRIGRPLEMADVPQPQPAADQLLIRVHACAVCRTDLHIADGELPSQRLPLILGHQIVGTVESAGDARLKRGDWVGVPWLGGTCGGCKFCLSERENLCISPTFTGYDVDGGFAEFTVARASFCVPLHVVDTPAATAPLLCGGAIGFRAFRLTGAAKRLGLYGFGSAGHILAQFARAEGREIYAFTRPGDRTAQELARELGADWVGGSDESPPVPLDAAIVFAPVGELVPQALRALERGGVVVCAGIHMSDIPAFPYALLWEERSIKSVANLTRNDAIDFLAQVRQRPIKTQVEVFPLNEANRAMDALRSGEVTGSVVLTIA